MQRSLTLTVVAIAAAVAAIGALLVAGGRNREGAGAGADQPAANAGLTQVVNPSQARGGTLRFGMAGDWDSLDPANTYYSFTWNFARLYGRSLTMFKPAPGEAGGTLVPDLAESLGRPNADSTTWTYRLREGVRFEDGSPVTSRDVKYAVERSLDKNTFPNGPTYLGDLLDVGDYTGPYSPAGAASTAIQTPDDRTIVFHLAQPFAGFDAIAQLPATMPVQRAKDTGTTFQQHVVSTGPYRFDGQVQSGKGFALVRNEQWDRATDPNRAALPDRIEVQVNLDAQDLDNRLLSGSLDVDVTGAGVQVATQSRILRDEHLRGRTDLAPSMTLTYTALNGQVEPLDDVHCRRAVEFATDKVSYQRSFGGPESGEIATNLLPPVINGAERFDRYPSNGHTGDLTKAKQELAACGEPDGFSTNLAYRADVPKDKAVAESLQQSLARAGIRLELKPYPPTDFYSLYAGNTIFARKNALGMIQTGWAADWPDGYGFISPVADSRTIREGGGNTNLSVRDPDVDRMIDAAIAEPDRAARDRRWSQIDRAVMDGAFILPGVWNRFLVYRPERLTNVFVSRGFGMYDYTALGVAP